MTYQRGAPGGMRRLRRELQQAGVEMARSRATIEKTMNEVCIVTAVPTDLRRKRLRRRDTWNRYVYCPGSLTVDVAREYAKPTTGGTSTWLPSDTAAAVSRAAGTVALVFG